jgi:hypothetical protein
LGRISWRNFTFMGHAKWRWHFLFLVNVLLLKSRGKGSWLMQ